MLVNICCSGSSGSTLLANLLNRHPDICCGDELGFFSKSILYDDYELFKKRYWVIKYFGLSDAPFSLERSMFRNLGTYGLGQEKVDSWVKNSCSMKVLTGCFHRYMADTTGKKIWAEKTPANIYSIEKFLREFPTAKIIHIVRDPRDVILSLMKRGHSPTTAAATWLLSVVCTTRIRAHRSLLEIRYEDLVNDPERVFEKICNHLSIKFTPEYIYEEKFKSKGLITSPGHVSWLNNPNEKISKTSVGKYKNETLDYNLLLYTKTTKEIAEYLNISQTTMYEELQFYGYESEPFGKKNRTARSGLDAYALSRNNLRSLTAYSFMRHLNGEQKIIPLVECA